MPGWVLLFGVDTEYPWRESHQCCEVSEGKRAEQRLGGGADKYLLTALPTYYFLISRWSYWKQKWIFTKMAWCKCGTHRWLALRAWFKMNTVWTNGAAPHAVNKHHVGSWKTYRGHLNGSKNTKKGQTYFFSHNLEHEVSSGQHWIPETRVAFVPKRKVIVTSLSSSSGAWGETVACHYLENHVWKPSRQFKTMCQDEMTLP